MGELEATFDVFEPAGWDRLWIVTHTVEPDSPSANAFALLGTLAATQEQGGGDRHAADPDASPGQ